MTVYFFKEDFRNVTEFYYKIILAALEKRGVKCVMKDSCTFKTALSIDKGDYILATTLRSFFILYLTGRRHFIFWYQGVTPEEVYLMKNSRWKYYIYSYIEKLSLKTVEYKIGVSKYMFDHFRNKYNLQIESSTVFIMPCFNSLLNEESFKTLHKYEKNIFCYAGSLEAWQGFESTLKIYSTIENKHKNVFLKIYAKDIKTAKKMIEKAKIKNFSVDCVPQSQIDYALADCKFGFIIREDNVINNVATPTKLGTYLANGVIPIFSSSVYSFRDLSKKYKYLCCVEDNNILERIDLILNNNFNCDSVLKEYRRIFTEYYNREYYIDIMSEFFLI